MILHAASIAAFFMDQLAQAPTQIQCVQQSMTESFLKQWIPTAVSLLSVGIGVWIADRSIRKNRELTLWSFRATSERDHERWVLDQKKAEWNQLLSAVYACQIFDFGHYSEMKHSHNGLLLPAALQIDQMNKVDHLMGCPIFIDVKVLEPLRFQLGELKKKRIVTIDAMEDIDGSDPQWKGREAEWKNILWIPSEERDKLLQSICESARKDLGPR